MTALEEDKEEILPSSSCYMYLAFNQDVSYHTITIQKQAKGKGVPGVWYSTLVDMRKS